MASSSSSVRTEPPSLVRAKDAFTTLWTPNFLYMPMTYPSLMVAFEIKLFGAPRLIHSNNRIP